MIMRIKPNITARFNWGGLPLQLKEIVLFHLINDTRDVSNYQDIVTGTRYIPGPELRSIDALALTNRENRDFVKYYKSLLVRDKIPVLDVSLHKEYALNAAWWLMRTTPNFKKNTTRIVITLNLYDKCLHKKLSNIFLAVIKPSRFLKQIDFEIQSKEDPIEVLRGTIGDYSKANKNKYKHVSNMIGAMCLVPTITQQNRFARSKFTVLEKPPAVNIYAGPLMAMWDVDDRSSLILWAPASNMRLPVTSAALMKERTYMKAKWDRMLERWVRLKY